MNETREDVMVWRDEMLDIMRVAAYQDVITRVPELKDTIDMLDVAERELGPEAILEQTLTHGLADYQQHMLLVYAARMVLINHFRDYEG